MIRICLALMISGLWSAISLAAANAPCLIQRAANVGPHVWLLCDQKDLLVSADEGRTWQVKHLPSEAGFSAIAFLDLRRGFVAGDRGTLLATEDGAETWRPVPLPTEENLTSIHFVGDLGWLAGWSGVVLHSHDGGRTWDRQPSGVRQGLDSIFFADADHGWAVGWVGTIIRTVNGGKTWEHVREPKATWSLSSVYFRDERHGWAVGFNGLILRSDDGGVTWKQQASPVQAGLTSVMYDKSGRGWITTDSQLLVSEDGGDTWRSISVDKTHFLHQVLPVSGALWAVGELGILRRASDGQGFEVLATLPGAGRGGGQS